MLQARPILFYTIFHNNKYNLPVNHFDFSVLTFKKIIKNIKLFFDTSRLECVLELF